MFRLELREALNSIDSLEYENFEEKFFSLLNLHAPMKQKIVRANHKPYMTKTLRKAMMKRSELETKYYKLKSEVDHRKFKKQRSLCSKLYKEKRRNHYENLNVNNTIDNCKCWETIKPIIRTKGATSSKINLVNNGETLSEDCDVAECFNDFSSTAVKSLNLNCDSQDLENVSERLAPIDSAIEKFINHPSIRNIKENVPFNSDFTFDFERVNSERIAKLISEVDPKKSGTFKGIPINVLKGSSDLCSSFLSEVWNEATIHLKQFLNKLKLAGVSQVFRIDDSTSVKNY